MFGDLVSSCYAEIHSSFADEGGYVSCWEEDERYGEVLDQCDVES